MFHSTRHLLTCQLWGGRPNNLLGGSSKDLQACPLTGSSLSLQKPDRHPLPTPFKASGRQHWPTDTGASTHLLGSSFLLCSFCKGEASAFRQSQASALALGGSALLQAAEAARRVPQPSSAISADEAAAGKASWTKFSHLFCF